MERGYLQIKWRNEDEKTFSGHLYDRYFIDVWM